MLRLSENASVERISGGGSKESLLVAPREASPMLLLRRTMSVFSVQRKNPQGCDDTFCTSLSATHWKFSSMPW